MRVAALVALLSAALGCSSLRQVEEPPPLPYAVPGEFTASAEIPSGVEMPDEDWWKTFDSDELVALVGEALGANLDIAAAVSRVDEAYAQARLVNADRKPSASVRLDSIRAKRNFIGLPIPGFEDNVLSTTATTHDLGLDVSWEIDLWGRLRAQTRAAEAELQATRSDWQATQLSISAQVARSWIRGLELQRQVELAERTLASRTRTREQIARRFRRGVVPSLDLRLALTEQELAVATVQRRLAALDATRRQLEILLGRYPSGAIELVDALPDLTSPPPSGLPATLVSRRPDLRAAESRLAASGAQLQQARRSLYPRLTLTGSGGTASNELGDLLNGDYSVWNLASSIVQPIFEGVRLRVGVQIAESRYEQAVTGFASTVLAALGEVETSLAAEGLLRAEEEALARAAGDAAAAASLAERRYAAGLVDFLSVLELQRQAFLTESELLALRRDRLLSRIDLIVALGGGLDGELTEDGARLASMESAP